MRSNNPAGRPAKGSRPSLVDPSARRVDGEGTLPAATQQRRFPVVVAAIPTPDGEVRVTLDNFKGSPTVDVRLFEPFTPAMVPMPTRKGVTLAVARLPELARALAEAEALARRKGLIGVDE